MTKHFLFKEGEWRGSGEINVPIDQETFPLTVRWTITPLDGKKYRAVQCVEVEGHDPMINTFMVGKVEKGEFQLFLENESIGTFSGIGVSDDKKLAWEFAHKDALQGFEVYERRADGWYNFRAEYLGGDGFATVITGTLTQVQK